MKPKANVTVNAATVKHLFKIFIAGFFLINEFSALSFISFAPFLAGSCPFTPMSD
jgi:hypothetical protein